jgi:opacity protein-like surface antigen
MRAIFALALGILLATPALAQPPQQKNEVFVGIGDPGVLWMFYEASSDVVTDIFTWGHVTYGDQQGGFQVTIGYQRWLNSWASAGVTGSWAGSSRTTYVNGRDSGDDEIQLLTLLVDGRGHWLRRPIVDLYSGIAIGATHVSNKFLDVPTGGDDEFTGLAFQLIPIGVRVGRNTGGFFETGFGTNGFVKAGLSQRF